MHAATKPRPGRVIVGLSGGVDSSVAALLLRQQGFEVHGLFMSNWEEDEEGYCSAAEDFQEARRVCEALSLPLHRASFAAEYRERVFNHFLSELEQGRTPNPDVLCNREIKFGAFLVHARRLGAERIATGHYARVDWREGRWRLSKGIDASKDQSYFLHALGQEALASTLFPLGELSKAEVRRLAREHGLPNHSRRDSTGICFIGERHFREFLPRYLTATPGEILSPEGEWLGTHAGLCCYTLGQRSGLAIGGRRGARDAPWYVVRKDVEHNRIIAAQDHDHPLLMSSALRVASMHWTAACAPALPLSCSARIRYRQTDQPCVVDALPDGGYAVRFARPQRAVTSGQYVVLYRDEECLGGGEIECEIR